MEGVGVNCSNWDCSTRNYSTRNYSTLFAEKQLFNTKIENCFQADDSKIKSLIFFLLRWIIFISVLSAVHDLTYPNLKCRTCS